MRKLIFPIIFLSILLTVSCGRIKIDPSAPDPFPEEGSTPPDLLITLERTACYGPCPIYKLSVKGDGSVEFDGEKFTETTGKAEGKISQEKIRELIKAFKEADYFGFDDSYDEKNCPASATDSSTVITSIQINGRKKTIKHYLGCADGTEEHRPYPAKLCELEYKIDEMVGTKRWIREGK